MTSFNRGDIAKMQEFIRYKEDAKKEFSDIRSRFDQINNELLNNWKGQGAIAYKNFTEHITEKVGNIADTLDVIVDKVLTDLVASYREMDNALEEYNLKAMNPPTEE